MKMSRFTESQIMQILKQAESGISAPELRREHCMSNATFYKWRAKYGGSIGWTTITIKTPTASFIRDRNQGWVIERK